MKQPYTIPSFEIIDALMVRYQSGMFQSPRPEAVVLEGYLRDDQCDEILKFGMREEPYEHVHCDAVTRELGFFGHASLAPIQSAARMANDFLFNFDLSDMPISWLQTYETGGSYQMHTDGAPGQSRKLTAVALLSDPQDYLGGDLEVHAYEDEYLIPRTRGTIVVFVPWVRHRVTPIRAGLRQTINMGFWGPPFR